MFKFDPQTQQKLRRFRSIRRGYYSLLVFVALLVLSFAAEMLVSKRALVVRYEGAWFFPTYGAVVPGTDLGLDYYLPNYRELKKKYAEENNGNFVILPIVPYGPEESDYGNGLVHPHPPDFATSHYLGTDIAGRDILARLVYGFRTAILFSLFLLFCNFTIGVIVGSIMGYWGGTFDLVFQRVIEIWSNIPFLYVVIILSSIMVPDFMMLAGIMAFFGWMPMTWYLRTITYKEKAREYVAAAQTIGASQSRIILRHILPNAISVIVTFAPFAVVSGISSLTALDYLGFGLPAPQASWGEMLSQGRGKLETAPWILASVVFAMVAVLMMVTFVGEAVREAFDPKKYTVYE